MTVTKHLRNIRIQEKNQQNLQGKLQKQTCWSVNSFVLTETPCVQRTPNKLLSLKYIAERTCVTHHFWRFDGTTFLIEIHCSANIGSLAINRGLIRAILTFQLLWYCHMMTLNFVSLTCHKHWPPRGNPVTVSSQPSRSGKPSRSGQIRHGQGKKSRSGFFT